MSTQTRKLDNIKADRPFEIEEEDNYSKSSTSWSSRMMYTSFKSRAGIKKNNFWEKSLDSITETLQASEYWATQNWKNQIMQPHIFKLELGKYIIHLYAQGGYLQTWNYYGLSGVLGLFFVFMLKHGKLQK